MYRCFSYPIFYKLQYLLSNFIIAAVTMFAAVFLFQTHDPLAIGLALLITVPILAHTYLWERRYSTLLPVEVQLEDRWVSLYRFRKYRRFHLDNVVSVRTDQSPGFAPPIIGGWVEVDYRVDDERERFYIGPYISGIVELVDILRKNIGYIPVEKVLFCWRRWVRFYQPIAAIGIIAITVVLAVATFQTSADAWQILEIAAYLAVIGTTIWTMSMIPICVEIGEDVIVFKFPIRPHVEVRSSDILSVDAGGHLGSFSFNVSFACIRLRNGKKIVLAPFFEGYTDMVSLLEERVERFH